MTTAGRTLLLRHGLHYRAPTTPGRIAPEDAPCIRWGVWRLFNLWRGAAEPLTRPAIAKFLRLETHFGRVSQRLFFTLQELAHVLLTMEAGTERAALMPHEEMYLTARAECLAEAVMPYVGTILDDIADLLPHLLKDSRLTDIDSMSRLLYETRTHDGPIADHLRTLRSEGSWYKLAFERKAGLRQLTVHNQHHAQLQMMKNAAGDVTLSMYLTRHDGNSTFNNFLANTRVVLSGLFCWLESLDRAIHDCVTPASYAPILRCPLVLMPVSQPNTRLVLEERFFPLPLSNEATPLPWAFAVPEYEVNT